MPLHWETECEPRVPCEDDDIDDVFELDDDEYVDCHRGTPKEIDEIRDAEDDDESFYCHPCASEACFSNWMSTLV